MPAKLLKPLGFVRSFGFIQMMFHQPHHVIRRAQDEQPRRRVELRNIRHEDMRVLLVILLLVLHVADGVLEGNLARSARNAAA